jgi:hypothetical protein
MAEDPVRGGDNLAALCGDFTPRTIEQISKRCCRIVVIIADKRGTAVKAAATTSEAVDARRR